MEINYPHNNFGAVIQNFNKDDLSLSKLVYFLLLERKVVILRGQLWTAQEYINLCANIGQIWTTNDDMAKEKHAQLDGYKEIVKISNTNGVLGNIELLWHADGSHHPVREYPIRCLYGAQFPDVTANTEFADLEMAYNQWPHDDRMKLETMKVLHRPRYVVGWESDLKYKPVIRQHPITKRKSISLDNYFTVQFENMTEQESKPIIDNLVQQATSYNNRFIHTWALGDLVLFDNNNTVHRRDKIEHLEERCLWRITMDFHPLCNLY